jgi:hypothetical protein
MAGIGRSTRYLDRLKQIVKAEIPDGDLGQGPRPRTAEESWRTIQWREGSNEWLSSRFARVRVHVASGHERSGEPTKE